MDSSGDDWSPLGEAPPMRFTSNINRSYFYSYMMDSRVKPNTVALSPSKENFSTAVYLQCDSFDEPDTTVSAQYAYLAVCPIQNCPESVQILPEAAAKVSKICAVINNGGENWGLLLADVNTSTVKNLISLQDYRQLIKFRVLLGEMLDTDVEDAKYNEHSVRQEDVPSIMRITKAASMMSNVHVGNKGKGVSHVGRHRWGRRE